MSDTRKVKIFWETTDVLNQSALLPHIMIIGSWAEYLFPYHLGSDFLPSLKTRDIDVYFGNHYREVPEARELINNFMTAGFLLDEYFIDTGKFFKEGIEVEFLSSQMGNGPGMVEIPFTGVKAEKLRNLDMLCPIQIQVRGYEIGIPSPASYIAHKLYINPERRPSPKRSKDIEAIRSLLLFVNQKSEEVTTLREFLNQLPDEKRERIAEVATACKLDIPSI